MKKLFYFFVMVAILSIEPSPAGLSQATTTVNAPAIQKPKVLKESENEKLKIISEINQKQINQLSTLVTKPEVKYIYRWRNRTIRDTIYLVANDKLDPADYFDQPCDTVFKHDTIYKTKIIRRPLIKL